MPSLIAMHWGAEMVPAELEGESFLPLLQVDHATSPGKQRVFSQYPHGLEYAASKHGHKNSSGSVMGCECPCRRHFGQKCVQEMRAGCRAHLVSLFFS